MTTSAQGLTVPPAPLKELPQRESTAIDLHRLPPNATFLRILGVNYVHLKTGEDGDMYITEHGLPFIRHLMPENWYEEQWFKSKRERLMGTSTVYRVPTRPLADHLVKSLQLVVKWSRVGEDVPLDTFTLQRAINAEFNTPFEEFSLVEEMRRGEYGPENIRILAQKPLAIYVPPERMQLWQSGRSREKILKKVARHPGVEIDILRSYILLYAWINGYNAVDAYKGTYYDDKTQAAQLVALTHSGNRDLELKGFLVADNKPTHFILRINDGQLLRRNGKIVYALVDYELLSRTPEHEDAVRRERRSEYLSRMRDRFQDHSPAAYPSQLKPARLLGVDYVHGRSESTNGVLWVVGKDSDLFNYFLPERWRTKQVRLSQTNETYYTQTKDRIHLVWKVSRVGELPREDPEQDETYRARLMHGYNSPFEEFAIALELQKKGVRTSYPRAIYMTGQQTGMTGCIIDERRFEQFRETLSPEGLPVLPMDHDYITIWGYWRGLEDDEAARESGYWNPIDPAQAYQKGIISAVEFQQVLERQKEILAKAGFVDLDPRPDHILLSYIPEGTIKKTAEGQFEQRQCNMEMIRRIG